MSGGRAARGRLVTGGAPPQVRTCPQEMLVRRAYRSQPRLAAYVAHHPWPDDDGAAASRGIAAAARPGEAIGEDAMHVPRPRFGRIFLADRPTIPKRSNAFQRCDLRSPWWRAPYQHFARTEVDPIGGGRPARPPAVGRLRAGPPPAHRPRVDRPSPRCLIHHSHAPRSAPGCLGKSRRCGAPGGPPPHRGGPLGQSPRGRGPVRGRGFGDVDDERRERAPSPTTRIGPAGAPGAWHRTRVGIGPSGRGRVERQCQWRRGSWSRVRRARGWG